MKRLFCFAFLLSLSPVFASAQEATPSLQRSGEESNEQRLLRLAEILGSLHYVRGLCEPTDGEFWRERMQEMLRLEKPSLDQKNRMTLKFNAGYEAASKQIKSCSAEARQLTSDSAREGEALAQQLSDQIAIDPQG